MRFAYHPGFDERRPGNDSCASARKCGQNIRNACVVAKRLADVGEAVDIAGAKNKACAELEWIFAQFVLAVAGGIGTFPRNGVSATQQVKQICAL